MNPDFLNRDVNANFSGGEKKRNEILQLSVLEVQRTSSSYGCHAMRTRKDQSIKLASCSDGGTPVTDAGQFSQVLLWGSTIWMWQAAYNAWDWLRLSTDKRSFVTAGGHCCVG